MACINLKGDCKVFIPQTYLLSYTHYPKETLYSVWHNSRSSELIIPEELSNYSNSTKRKILKVFPEYKSFENPLEEILKNILTLNLQVSDFVQLNFFTKNMPNYLRDQLVRHRQLNIWAQTSRTIVDLSQFDCNIPEEIEIDPEAKQIYEVTINNIRSGYKNLQELGYHPEDIRLQPQQVVYGLNWGGQLRAILHVLNQRLSWYAQIKIWYPLIRDCIYHLKSIFGEYILENCLGINEDVVIKDNKIISYNKELEALSRWNGNDLNQIPDPFWIKFHKKEKDKKWLKYVDTERYQNLKSFYSALWSKKYLNVLEWD